MAIIPKVLHEHINTAFPANVCLVGTVLPNGFAQVSPRGSTMVYDDEHLALWERGKGSTNATLKSGTKVTVFRRLSGCCRERVSPMARICACACVRSTPGWSLPTAW